jgi:hypothetical protein
MRNGGVTRQKQNVCYFKNKIKFVRIHNSWVLFNAVESVSCLDGTVEFHQNYLSTFQFLKSNSDTRLNVYR